MIIEKLKFYYKHKWLPRRNKRLAENIHSSAPVLTDDASKAEIHVLTSSKDHLMLLWALKSFYHVSGKRYPLVIHDDGSLGDAEAAVLMKHFPNARLIKKAEADAEIKKALVDYPKSLEFRFSNHLAPKVFDFYHFASRERILLMDSDVLFFEKPEVLINRIEDADYLKNSVNADVADAYTVDSAIATEQLGVIIPSRFNSGLGLIHRQSLAPGVVEDLLALPGIIGHFWRIEQTIYMLCSAKWGCELLPQEYNVHLGSGIKGPVRHYVGAVRQQFYDEGIKTLLNRLTRRS